MHQSTQRRLCRSLFVALCLVPTLGLLAYAAWLRLPAYRRGWVDELQDATGLQIALDDVRHPAAGTTRLAGLVARDPLSGALVAEVREIHITRRGRVVRLQAMQPRLQTRQLAALWRRLEDRCLLGTAGEDIELECGAATFVSPDGRGQTLTDLRVELRRGGSRSFRAAYRVAGVAMPDPAEVRIEWSNREDPSVTTLSWQTGGAALPTAPWAGRFPALGRLGPRAEFRGTAAIELRAAAWSAVLSGELAHVDLDRLVSGQFPHKLSGEARIALQRAEVRDGQLVSATGRLEAGPGVIGRSLIDAACEHWQLTRPDGAMTEENSGPRQRYARVGARFELHGSRLQLAGDCPGGAAETILIGDGQAAWQTPGENSFSSISLIRVLAGSGEPALPATAAARQLVRILPLPEGVRADALREPPRGHLRP